MVYEIRKENQHIFAGTKAEVVEYIVARDAWRLGRKPDADKARYCGEGTKGYDPDVYVPTFFDEVAMNPNDNRTLMAPRYSVMPTKPIMSYGWANKASRPYIVTDEDGRTVHVREWLEECRAALRNAAGKPREIILGQPREITYRNTSGLRQALTGFWADEDYLELVGNVPSRFTRTSRGKNAATPRRRNTSRSWKETKGCIRSWQKKTARGRMPSKASPPLDFDALASELVSTN